MSEPVASVFTGMSITTKFIIASIIVLAIGLFYVYKHFTNFQNAVNKLFYQIKLDAENSSDDIPKETSQHHNEKDGIIHEKIIQNENEDT